MRIDLQSIKLFIDTHGKASGKDDFAGVYRQYAEACRAEGVVVVNTMVSAGEGRMYCVNLAPTRIASHLGVTREAVSRGIARLKRAKRVGTGRGWIRLVR